jgi:hypothetical protein
MAVPVSDPDDRSPAAPTRPSLIQVAASALAAVSAAVIASLFGVAGTMIGAAVASVVTTVGVALYSESLHRTHAGIRRAGRQLARLPMLGAPEDRSVGTGGMPLLPDHLNPRRGPARRRWLRWSTVAATVVAVFAIAMGVVTVVELIGQQPVAALVGGSSQSGTTTIGSLSTGIGGGGKSPVTPAPSTASGSSSAGSSSTQSASPRSTTARATASATRSASASATASPAPRSGPTSSVDHPPTAAPQQSGTASSGAEQP